MNILKSIFVFGAMTFIVNNSFGQDHKNRLQDHGQVSIIDPTPVITTTDADGIPLYIAELKIKGKIFEVRSVTFTYDWDKNGIVYNLEQVFSFNSIPRSLFTDAEVVELISKYKWQLDEDILKINIQKVANPGSWTKSTELPSYVEFNIKKILIK